MEQTQQISMQYTCFSIDLLQRFNPNATTPKNELEQEEIQNSEEIELTLGLSSNGRFGVDPSSKRLKLSSSTPNFTIPVKKHEESKEEGEDSEAMTWQSMLVSRKEAKRKRMEKQRGLRVAKRWDVDTLGEKCEQDSKVIEDKGEIFINGDHQCIKVLMPPRVVKKCAEPRSPTNTPALTEVSANEPAAVNCATTEKLENPSKTLPNDDKESGKIVRNVMLGMLSVSTVGQGPNGKKIEGLVYPCKDGEEVKIFCVCHGSFLSASDFVKHAGGGEVANPLKHIVVNPPPSVL